MQDTTTGNNNKTGQLPVRTGPDEEKTLGEIYAANYPAIEKFILANSGTREDAKDIYQESFLSFWRNVQLSKFEAKHANAVRSYLLRIAKNKWIDVLRRNKKANVQQLEADLADEEILPGISQEQEEHLLRIRQHYKNMGEPCKELLYRFYFQKETLKQIASRFSWTDATAKNNKYRCLLKLRNLVVNK